MGHMYWDILLMEIFSLCCFVFLDGAENALGNYVGDTIYVKFFALSISLWSQFNINTMYI